MTLDAMDWVWRQARSRGNARLALLAVADATTGPDATAPMGAAEFMRRLGGVPKSTALDAIRRACEAGELAIERPAAGSRPALYRLPGAVNYTRHTPNSGRESRPQTPEPQRSETPTTSEQRSETPTTNPTDSGRDSRPLQEEWSDGLWSENPTACGRESLPHHSPIERVSEGVREDGPPSAVVPDFATDLVAAITAAKVYVAWNLTPGEWFQVDAMVKRSGADMLASVAVKAAAKKDISHARYFLRAWQSLPPAPTAGTVPAAAPTGPGADVIPLDRTAPRRMGRAAQAAQWYAELAAEEH